MNKVVLIYFGGDEYDHYYEIKEFKDTDSMLEFINNEGIGSAIVKAYEFYEEIKLEPFEKVIRYKIKK